MKFLCNLEAMNLDNMFRDCQDLNTIRGGGLSILNIADRVSELLHAEQISAGASQGLLLLESETAEDAEASVRGALAQVDILKHATIMISVEPYDQTKFKEQRAQLRARNRWRQMQSPSLVYPALKGSCICSVDKVRPGTDRPDLVEKGVQSDFTAERRTLGRAEKKKLLQDILGEDILKGADVVHDLNELCHGDQGLGNSNDKIAVLCFDGNDFGRIVNQCNQEQLKIFSTTTRKQQSTFFQELVKGREYQHHGWIGKGTLVPKLRLEVLVYGGDEVTFVVPAWLGWEALHCFYKQAEEWDKFLGRPITYSGGIVFCHHNAPIHAVRDLASGLADQAKLLRGTNKKGNFAAYQILESFDSVGQALEEHIKERYQHLDAKGILLNHETISLLKENMSYLRSSIARRKLYRLVSGLTRGVAPEDWVKARNALLDSVNECAAKKTPLTLEKLQELMGPAAYLHLLELWDYVGVADQATGGAR